MIKKLISLFNKNKDKKAEGIYRFSIVKIHQREVGYDCKIDDYASEKPFDGFKAPNGMTEKQMYKTMSYIFKQVKNSNNNSAEFANEKDVENVYDILPKFGFDVIGAAPINAKRISVITGKCYKETKALFEPYQDQWFDGLVSRTQIEKIYDKLGLQLPNVETKKNHRSVV